ncbi:MAG: hypothetical protein U0Y10_02000 [Spirosomataceae bacterium]
METNNPEYEVNIAHIWRKAIHVKGLPDECFEELLNYYESICDDEEKYGEKLSIERYEAKRHFYFVDKFEALATRKEEHITDLQEVRFGYVVRAHEMSSTEEKLWEEEIKEVLSNELPDRLKTINVEALIEEANNFWGIDASQQVKDDWVSFQKGRHVANDKRIFEDDIREARRWIYDIYWFRHSYITLNYNPEDIEGCKKFMYFYTWMLVTCEIQEFDTFLSYHFKQSFRSNWDRYGRFLEVLKITYQDSLLKGKPLELLDRWLTSNSFRIILPESIEATSQSKENHTINPEIPVKKVGRTPSEKLEIPKPKVRSPNDRRTILNKDETVRLFNHLAQLNCIFNNTDEISKDSFSKAVQVLTGFSAGQTEESFIYEEVVCKSKAEKKKIIEDIKTLIISAIEKQFGGL